MGRELLSRHQRASIILLFALVAGLVAHTSAMAPPLPPKSLGYVLKSPAAPVRVELFLDLICPFSRKMWKAIREICASDAMNGDDVCFIMHQVPQPWHAQGSYVHEAALAVKAVAPETYPAFVDSILAAFDEGRFADRDTWDKSRAREHPALRISKLSLQAPGLVLRASPIALGFDVPCLANCAWV